MEIAGLVVGVIPLVTMANDLHKSIQRLRLNPQRSKHLTELVDKLVQILGTASSTSSAAEEFVRSAVQEVKSTLESQARKMCYLPKIVSGRLAEADKLDEVERKLKSLTTQVVVVQSIFQLKEEVLPRIFNERMELPACTVGLDRAENVLDFLRRSAGEQLRVVGIHGLPGLGKTTLLNRVWNKASSIAPFSAQAHIQIGQSISDTQICTLQSILLQQLGGERNLQFPALEGGRQKLKEHLQQLKHDKKPVFLAIDNVYEDEALGKLLPATLSTDIPACSVIAITCRRFTIVQALLSISCLQQDNGSQVYLFKPECLNLAESKAVFAECGGLSNDADAELLESLVPLCGGLPLALTVLGKLFAGNSRRSREEWELIKDQMQEKLDGDDIETRRVTNALQVSYDQLSERCKVAFCEVVKCFYGWKWERVERILGGSVLKVLKDSSLISEVDYWSKCNQSALREGFDMDTWTLGSWTMWEMGDTRRAVTMHDLTLKFGEGLRTNLSVITTTDSQSMRGRFQQLEAPKLSNLIWWRVHPDEGEAELEFLEKAASLRTLFLSSVQNIWHQRPPLLKASSYTNILSTEGQQPLHFLRLEGWKSSRIIMEMKVSCEIREIHLHDCQDVEQLPDTSLHKLEMLSIFWCQNFQYFSPSSVGTWCKLKCLEVSYCNRFRSVPAELGRLENLSHLMIGGCPSLQALPTISCPLQILQLSYIPIANLDLQETACSCLQDISLQGCNSLEVLPSSVWKAKRLTMLKCNKIKELPDEVGKLAALTVLHLNQCKSLKGLPPSIVNAASLHDLQLRWYESVVELPDEVGKLAALTRLDLSMWKSLKGLPPSIGSATSLQALMLKGCESLVELPDEMGKLTALTELDLSMCKSLKGLPSAIGNATSLRALSLQWCEGLVELPNEVGKLSALIKLDLSGCKSLKGLPPAIWSAVPLRVLKSEGCGSLVEPADEVGKLAALITVNLSGCKNLKEALLKTGEDYYSRTLSTLNSRLEKLTLKKSLGTEQIVELASLRSKRDMLVAADLSLVLKLQYL